MFGDVGSTIIITPEWKVIFLNQFLIIMTFDNRSLQKAFFFYVAVLQFLTLYR